MTGDHFKVSNYSAGAPYFTPKLYLELANDGVEMHSDVEMLTIKIQYSADIQLRQNLIQVQSTAVNCLHVEISSSSLAVLGFQSSDHELRTLTAEPPMTSITGTTQDLLILKHVL